MIDRGDISGFSLAVAGHVGLIALIVFLAPTGELVSQPPITPAIEVTLTDEVGLEATVPDPGTEDPAARLSPVEAPVEPDSAPPAEESKPEEAAKPTPPKPAPAPDARDRRRPDQPNAAAPNSRPNPKPPTRPSGRLDGLDIDAPGNKPNNSTSVKPPAPIGPAVRNSLAAEVLRQIKPFWVPPSGADSDSLRTSVRVQLDRSGNITGLGDCRQSGLTASNRPQAGLACENAKRAIRRAAPFKLPDQFYDAWKTIEPTLYEGL